MTIEKADWLFESDGFYLKFKVKNREEGQRIVAEVKSSDKPYELTVEKKKRKRSLDANAYCWVLIGKLAAKLHLSMIDIYRDAIKNIGDNFETICVQDKAVDKLRDWWERNGLGWLTETFPSKIPECTNVQLFYGSSAYDTAQMSRLIDNIVQECKAQGIETMTPEKLDRLKEAWK
nr:MAG TPA: NinB protein [Myoviridae sp. ct5FH28]